LYLALEVELVGMIFYAMFFQCFNLSLGGLILVQTFICVLMLRYSLLIYFDRDRPNRLRDAVTLGESSLYIRATAMKIATHEHVTPCVTVLVFTSQLLPLVP
jgi:hypothetical protein